MKCNLEASFYMMNSKHTVIVFSLLLAACANVSQPDMRQAGQPESKSEDQAEDRVDLPRLELTGQLLYEFMLGDVALQRGRPDLAAQTYLELARATRDPRVARYAAHLAAETRQMGRALAAARLWLELEPDSLRAKRMLVTLLLGGGMLDEARPHLAGLLAADPGNAFLQIYPMLARHPDKAAAFDLALELTQPYPRVAEARWVLAQGAEAAGKHEVAVAEARQARSLRPEWDKAVLLEAQLLRAEAPQQALAVLQKHLASYPDNKDVRLYYARALMERKQYQSARTEFQRLLDANPDNADLAFAVALLSLEMGELDRAERELRQALVNGKKDENAVYYYLGQLHEAKKHDAEALQNYRKVEEGEYAFPARTRMAFLLNKAGKLEEARQTLHQIEAQDDQQRVQLLLIEAQLLRDNKQPEAAYRVLTQVMEKLPNHPELLYEAAMLADQIGKHETSEQLLRQLIQNKPDHAHAYNALGYSMLERNERIHEAMQLVGKALQLAPDDPAIIDSMGWGYYRLGNLAKSVEFLRRAYTANPDPEIAAHLGEVLWMQGNRREATKIWQQARKAHADNAVLEAVVKKFLP